MSQEHITVTETSEGWRIENEHNSSVTLTKEQIGLLYHQVFTGAKHTDQTEVIGVCKNKCPRCNGRLYHPDHTGSVKCRDCGKWFA